jgi:hypothetical protein
MAFNDMFETAYELADLADLGKIGPIPNIPYQLLFLLAITTRTMKHVF